MSPTNRLVESWSKTKYLTGCHTVEPDVRSTSSFAEGCVAYFSVGIAPVSLHYLLPIFFAAYALVFVKARIASGE